MKKFAIIKSGHGEVGVWRVLETKEDIAPYPYIEYAISKYGWDDVMPAYMNKVGGYTSWSPENVLDIFECETWPTFRDCEFYREYVRNKDFFHCGWISPSGNTYMCRSYGHADLAEDLVDLMYSESYKKYRKATGLHVPDDFLLQNGWIKVNTLSDCIYWFDKVSDAAMATLNRLQTK